MSVLVYDCGSVENTVTAILDTESGAMIIRGNGDIDNYADESSPWYSEHSDILQVTVDKGITRIGSGTFYGCENLSFVEIASTVTSIGADVFKNCTALSRIKIPKTITNISNGAFADSGLSEIKFYGNPPTVGTDIFDGVTADVYTPEGNEEWTETAKGTVAGNGSNLTWKTFDSKPNLIEYDELDYLWSKIKKYVDSNVSVTQVVSSGTKIATITINGVATDIYSSGGLSGTVGSSTTPIYIDNGVPTACGGSLAVDITGNAVTATTATNTNNVKLTHAVDNNERPLVLGTSGVITDETQELRIGNPVAGIANNPLRAKAYCAPANTQGEAHIVIGNNIAKTAANNARGSIYIFGTSTYRLRMLCEPAANKDITIATTGGDARTYTLPDATGTIALTSSNITGSSGSCTGNAATATSATSATTATNSNNSKLTHTVGNTEYPLVFGSSFVITDAQQVLRIGTPTATAANCALRCKAYCAAANTQGEAYLVCGNNIAKASANNSRGSIYLYGTNAYNTRILPSDTSANITITLPASTGTLALANANTTGSSGSCTGNAASATYATNIRVTDTDSNTWYPIVLSSGSAASTNYAARVDADSILAYPGVAPAAKTQGNCYLQLGNAKATATAGNKRGHLRIFGVNTSYSEIVSGVATTARTFTLPDITGLAVVSSDSTVYNISVVTALPSSPNAKTIYLVK